jgi:hypothetical protein
MPDCDRFDTSLTELHIYLSIHTLRYCNAPHDRVWSENARTDSAVVAAFFAIIEARCLRRLPAGRLRKDHRGVPDVRLKRVDLKTS